MVIKKAGFTLSEVLITLGIIGVVAAMTIPNLMQKIFEKQVVSQLQKSHAILAQAFRMAEEEYGDAESWDIKTSNRNDIIRAASYLKPFLKIAKDCGTNDPTGSCIPVSSYKHLNGSVDGNSTTYRTNPYYYKFLLLDGTSFWIASPVNEQVFWIYVDVNGKSAPNVIGKDLFLFSYSNKTLYPEGSPTSPYVRRCGLNSGWGCAYYVLTNKNMDYLH